MKEHQDDSHDIRFLTKKHQEHLGHLEWYSTKLVVPHSTRNVQSGHQRDTNISKERKITRIPLRRGSLAGIISKFFHEDIMLKLFPCRIVQVCKRLTH
jgi:hypothetical protein